MFLLSHHRTLFFIQRVFNFACHETIRVSFKSTQASASAKVNALVVIQRTGILSGVFDLAVTCRDSLEFCGLLCLVHQFVIVSSAYQMSLVFWRIIAAGQIDRPNQALVICQLRVVNHLSPTAKMVSFGVHNPR